MPGPDAKPPAAPLPPAGGQGARALRALALRGLVLNVALALIKLVAGIVGTSFALVADALESMVDIVGSVVVWGGLRYGEKPPDEDHPYGHGRAEALAGLVVALIVVCAGVAVGVESVSEIIHPHHPPAWWTLLVLALVVIAKETMARITDRAAQRQGSAIGAVDAGHHRADAITSAAAFIGIAIALAGPHLFGPHPHWAAADDYAALLAGGIIVYNGVRLARLPLRELMDEQPAGIVDEARARALQVPGVRGIEKARAFTRGSRSWIELHVEVDADLTVAEAHVIGGKVRHALRTGDQRIADVHVHIEPAPSSMS